MMAEANFYRDLAYVFGAAVAGGAVARLFKQPMILGYVLGGILVGPFTPGPQLSNVHHFEELAEVGVILLMYSIGLEFSFDDLMRVKWVAIFGAPLGIAASIGLGLGLAWIFGYSWQEGVALGAIVSVASTMVLSRLLDECGLLRAEQGQIMIGITLMEDIAVVIMTILLPSIGSMTGDRLLGVMVGLGKSILILTPVVLLAYKFVPRLMKAVIKTGSPEFLVLVALALSFATAAITQAAGLSLALGAFLAGLLVSEGEDAHNILQQLLPLRDAFVALFFVTIGALVDPHILISRPGLLLLIVAMTMLGKFVIWALVLKAFRYSWHTALMVGVGLTQIGEFSYVLVQVARDAKVVGNDLYNATLAASLITILLNGFAVRFAYGRPWGAKKAAPA
jgi:monovalent cation:H+ antiporter-2, CPA2 family